MIYLKYKTVGDVWEEFTQMERDLMVWVLKDDNITVATLPFVRLSRVGNAAGWPATHLGRKLVKFIHTKLDDNHDAGSAPQDQD